MPVETAEILGLIRSIFPFRKMPDNLIEIVADNLGTSYFEEGQTVYEEGDDVDQLYIVLNGQVTLARSEGHGDNAEEVDLTILSRGDIFGFEILNANGRYLTTAYASQGVTVLTINLEHLGVLMDEITFFKMDLQALLNSFRLWLQVKFKWVAPDEKITYVARRHLFFLARKLFPPFLVALISLPLLVLLNSSFMGMAIPILALGLDVVGILLWMVWVVVDWSNDYSIVTNQRVLFQEKVVLLYESRTEAPLGAVLSVTSKTDQVGRILDYGDVVIRTYAGQIILPDVRSPKKVALYLEAQVERAKAARARSEKESLTGIVRNRLGGAQKSPQKPSPKEPVDQPGRLQNFLTTLFELRYEKGGVIIYRTHWLILFRKIGLPSLLILGLFTVMILRITNEVAFLSLEAVLAVSFLLLIFVAIWWTYQYADWRNDLYIITEDTVVDVYKKPLGTEKRQTAPMKNIQSVEYERLGFIGMMFNFGTVYIQVGDTKLTFDEVYNPSGVQKELFKRIAERDYKEKQTTLQSERDRMSDWIETYYKVMVEKGSASGPPAQPSPPEVTMKN